MKHDPKVYAKAFAAVAAGSLDAAQERTIVQNFSRLIVERVGRSQWPKFLAAAEKALREKAGVRKVTITSARPLNENVRSTLNGFLKKEDVIEEKVDSEIVAGIKVTIDDSRQFDGSLAGKLEKLFGESRQSF